MTLGILIPLTIAAAVSLVLYIPLIAMMAGGSKGATVLFAFLLVAPILAAAGWVMYLAQMALNGLGVPYAGFVGLIVILVFGLVPKFVLGPAADRAAARYQAQDVALQPITPDGTILVSPKEYNGHRAAARSKEELVTKLLFGGFDGVVFLDFKGDRTRDTFEAVHITPKGKEARSALEAGSAPPELSEQQWQDFFETNEAGIETATVAFLTERQIENRKIFGLPHRFEILTERLAVRQDAGWQDIGRETWVKYSAYDRPIVISSNKTLKPAQGDKRMSFRGVLPAIWPNHKTSDMHPPQNGMGPVDLTTGKLRPVTR